jgi:nucleoside-diphosphate-sugar epimerase
VTRRVLVTGARGFIGRHAVAALRERGFEVHEAGRRDGDLLAPGGPRRLVDETEPTHLLHLAWNTEPGRYWTTPENLAWTEASLALYRAFAERGGERAVLAGTCAEYDWTQGMCREDATPLRPATLYGASKHALSTAVAAYGDAYGPPTAWGRVFFLYGPGEHPARLVPAVIRGLLARERVAVTHGRQVRDFMHVADVGAAFAALVDRDDVAGAVNVASGEPVSLREIVAAISARLDGEGLVGFGERPVPAGEPTVLVADATRLREEAGFVPRHDLASGLDDAIAWWRGRA